MNKLLSIILTVFILLAALPLGSFSAFAEDNKINPISNPSVAASVEVPGSYDRLEQYVDIALFRDYIFSHLKNEEASFDISRFEIPATRENCDAVRNFLHYGIPQAFNLNTGNPSYQDTGIIKTVYATYRIFEEDYITLYNAMKQHADILLKDIKGNDNLNDIEKALLLHDRLAAHNKYDIDGFNSGNVPYISFTAYGALVNRVSVCDGYTKAYMYLLNEVGIKNIRCVSAQLNHSWNIVYINSKPYHVDVTWDDFDSQDIGHKNFLKSTEYFKNNGHRNENDPIDYNSAPTDTALDNYFWNDVSEGFQYLNNALYYVSTTGNPSVGIKQFINKYSGGVISQLLEITENWPNSYNSGDSPYKYTRICSDGKNILYSTPTEVYAYNPNTGYRKIVYTPNGVGYNNKYIYGLDFKDGKIICTLAISVLLENAETLTEVCDSNNPKELLGITVIKNPPSVFIGDPINLTGTQLKLSYNTGNDVHIADGFECISFSSDRGGITDAVISYNGKTANANVDVVTPSITLSHTKLILKPGDQMELTATTNPVGGAIEWSIYNGSESESGNGSIVAYKVGRNVLTAKFQYNGRTYSSDCEIIIKKEGVGVGWTNIGGYWYYGTDVGIPHKGWLQLAGNWYYFNSDCIMQTGMVKIDGTTYYFNDNGTMYKGWFQISNRWYYFGEYGTVKGWQWIGNHWYYFNNNGVMLTGWQTINNHQYYFGPSGNMVTGWLYQSGSWYWLNPSGDMATGWLNISGTWYYFSGSGAMATGWKLINNTWYFFGNSGNMLTGWQFIGNNWYYFDVGGNMLTGWQWIGNGWYYFHSGGNMATGWLLDNGYWYWLEPSGIWLGHSQLA